MTAPPLKKSQTNCKNKVRYSDEFAARAGSMVSIELHGNVDELYVYKCRHCNGWHLTKQRQRTAAVTVEDPYTEVY